MFRQMLAALLEAASRGHCGAEAAWLYQPGLDFLAPALLILAAFLSLYCFAPWSMVVGRLCIMSRKRCSVLTLDALSDCTHPGTGLLCDLGPVS